VHINEYVGNEEKVRFAPPICFKCLHKLLEVTTTPVREPFFDISLFLSEFLLRQGLSYNISQGSERPDWAIGAQTIVNKFLCSLTLFLQLFRSVFRALWFSGSGYNTIESLST
jgi:hypothetical protein